LGVGLGAAPPPPPWCYFVGEDSCLELAEREGKGRYLVARRPIPAGQDVLSAAPFGVGVHESHRKRFCQGCYCFTHLQPSDDEMNKDGDGTVGALPRSENKMEEAGRESRVQEEESPSKELEERKETQQDEEEEMKQQQEKKASRKLTAQVWCERCRQSWYCTTSCKEQDQLHVLQCPALALLSSCKLSKEDKTIVRLFLHIMAKRELEIINGLSTSCWTPTFDDFLCLVSNTPSIESSPDRYKSDMEVVKCIEKMLSCCTLKHNYSSSELLDYISKIEATLSECGVISWCQWGWFSTSKARISTTAALPTVEHVQWRARQFSLWPPVALPRVKRFVSGTLM